jgi:hypothetical protein
MELVVDTVDNYEPDSNLFYMPGPHVSMLKCVRPNQFSSAKIVNTDVDYLTSYALANLYSTLRPGAEVSITISQPVAVMQEYDAKQVEANARLAGFNDIEMNSTSYTDPKTGRDVATTEVVLKKTERDVSEIKGGKKNVVTKEVVVTRGGRQTSSTGNRRRK